MPITNSDLDVAPVVLSPMVLTDTTETLLTNIISNIQANKSTTEGLNQATEDKYNEVITSVNAIKAGSEVDIDGLTDSVKDIISLQVGEEGSETFLEAFRVLEAELDRRKTTYAFRHTVTSSVAGKFSIDVSAYGFATDADYNIIVKVPTQVDGQSISGTCRVISATEAEVTLRDEDVFQGKNIETSFYDAAVEGELEVVLMVVGTSNPVGLTIDTSAFKLQADMSATVTGWGLYYQNTSYTAVEVSNPDSLPITARFLDANYDEVVTLSQDTGLNDIAFTTINGRLNLAGGAGAVKYVELTHATNGTVDVWELASFEEIGIAEFSTTASINDAGRVVGVVPEFADPAPVMPTLVGDDFSVAVTMLSMPPLDPNDPPMDEYEYRLTASNLTTELYGVDSLDDVSFTITAQPYGTEFIALGSELTGGAKLLENIASQGGVSTFDIVATRTTDNEQSNVLSVNA